MIGPDQARSRSALYGQSRSNTVGARYDTERWEGLDPWRAMPGDPLDYARAVPGTVRSPNEDYGEYIDQRDASQRAEARASHATPWAALDAANVPWT